MLSNDAIINLRSRQMSPLNKSERIALPNGEDHLRYAQDLLVQARGLLHRFDESMALMRHSLLLGEEFDFHEHVIYCLQEIAIAYYVQCEYDLALQYWSYCLDVSLNLSDDEAYIQAQIGIGQIYFAHDDFVAALEHHQQAAESLPKINNDALRSSLLINLGADYVQLMQYAEALRVLEEGLFLAQKSLHLEYASEALSLIGQAQWGLGDPSLAEQTLQAALSLNKKINRLWGMASSLLALGRLSLAEKNLSLAAQYLTDGLSKATERNALHMVFQFEQLLAELAELQGDYPLALSHFKRFHFGKEAIKNQLSPHKLQAMKMQLEMESARLENADLRRQRASQHKEIQRVERLASYDGLTGILNRRGLEEQGSELFQRQRINQQSLSVLMIDVDHFKRVNDGCGHPVGDKVLRQIAALLKSGCRQDDLVGRYGGEEFVVLLPNHEGVAATEVGERLRRIVDAWLWSRIHPKLQITISIGIASIVDDVSLESLLSRSDQCLYLAKQQGRNRVVV
jgi:two-component system, cell cycle response regulator